MHLVLSEEEEKKRKRMHTGKRYAASAVQAKRQVVCHVIYFYSLPGDTCKADASGIK